MAIKKDSEFPVAGESEWRLFRNVIRSRGISRKWFQVEDFDVMRLE
ncbi:MAG: hypothetical protein LBD80_00280 [Tannerella sp.]|nr:hypothetical protein [Tannerella sp.]